VSYPIFIMDIDGVLVDPQGYRRAAQATLDWFTQRIGIGPFILTEDILDHFEAQNISSEFDIVPLCLAEVFDEVIARYPDIQLTADIYDSCEILRENGLQLNQVNFKGMASRVSQIANASDFPSVFALKANQMGSPHPPFGHLCSHPLIEHILSHTRDVNRSPITRVFQQFVLGSHEFEKAYGMKAEIDTHSYLSTYDKPLLDDQLAELLKKVWVNGDLGLVAYTGRPSLPPDGNHQPILPFSPEANLALDVVKLSDIPIIGLGQIYRLAEIIGGNPDNLGKPSLISSLGVIAAAFFKDELGGLLYAERWIYQNDPNYFTHLPTLDVHLFEDTPGSIPRLREAVKMLCELGISTRFQAWGIARSADKVSALQGAGAEIQEDINAAIQAALKLIKIPLCS